MFLLSLIKSDFVLQVDKSTDISGKEQCCALVCFVQGNEIINNFYAVFLKERLRFISCYD